MEKITNFIQTYIVNYINIWISGVLIILFIIFTYIALRNSGE